MLSKYLVDFDADGATIIRTNLAERLARDHGRAAFQRTHHYTATRTEGTYFMVERGTGQGDVSSSLNWNALFDIFLHALGSTNVIQSEFSATNCSRFHDAGFANDLLCYSTSLPILQRKADIISAFSILCGLQLSHEKFRATMPDWISSNIKQTASVKHAPIYKHFWQDFTEVELLS